MHVHSQSLQVPNLVILSWSVTQNAKSFAVKSLLSFPCLWGVENSGSFLCAKRSATWSKILRATLKVIPSILWCWPTMSEADVGSMVIVWTFPQTFYYTLLVWDRWQQWGNLTEGWMIQSVSLNSPCGKNSTNWPSSMLALHFWGVSGGGEHSEVVCHVFQKWWQWQ